MAKTYYPGAVRIADKAHKYLTRYQQSLSQGITTDQAAALTELVACLAAFLVKWLKPAILP